ncbi:hypothetical protein [Streptomyces otsuchiensis]|uniref:hypothetical protein n=1 Tax=Streptomyces otsuchiensis TaxID=2681388 RepID=UPI0013003764|nr:hypothetical protein [Streptomyces otsuchiensis]
MRILRARCERCGQKRPDVVEMDDPFEAALFPEETPTRVWLDPECAIERFEDS